MNSKNSEEKQQDEEAGPFPIPSNKYTNPGIKDQLRTLYGTLEEFYLISHRIKTQSGIPDSQIQIKTHRPLVPRVLQNETRTTA